MATSTLATPAVTAPAAVTARRKGPTILLALPALIFFVAFALVPLLGVVVLSFMRWDGSTPPPGPDLSNWTHGADRPGHLGALWLSSRSWCSPG